MSTRTPAPESSSTSASSPQALPTTPVRRVLVVEDSEFVHQIYRVAFRRLKGWEVLHARNGLEGLRTLDEQPVIDLVLLDINMPVMDGLQFLEQLRLIRSHRSTFVVIVSTEEEDGKIRAAIQRGAQAYLKKPFTLDQLLDLLARIVPLLPARAQPA